MAKDPLVKIQTEVDQKGLDKGLGEVTKKVEKTSKEGSSMFKEMFEALSLEKVVEKGFEVVKDFFKESIEGSKDAQLNTVKLQNALQNLGRSSDLKDLGEDAEELGKKFAIPKDSITKSQTALVSYGKLTTKQIKDIEPIIINFSRKTGKSMDESTQSIIKGLAGQGRELKKLGVDLVKGGTTTQNYNTIVDQLGAKVDGAADAFNNTEAGGMARFHTTLEELEVNVGEKLLPALADLTSAFTPLLEQVAPLVDEIVPTLISLMKSLAPLFVSLGEVVIKVMKPVGEIFSIVSDALADLMPTLTPVIDAFGDLASSVLTALIPPIKEVVLIFDKIIKTTLPPLKSEFQVLSKIFVVVGRVLNIIFTIVNKLVTKFTDMFKSSKQAGDGLNVFNKIITKITDSLKAAYKWVSELLDKVESFLGINSKKNSTKDAIIEIGEASIDTGDRIQNSNDEVDKNADKLAKKEAARQKKLQKETLKNVEEEDKARTKSNEAHEKALKELADLKEKYYATDRDRLAKQYDDDIQKLNDTGIMDLKLQQDLLDKKAAALQKYDDDQLQNELDSLTAQNEADDEYAKEKKEKLKKQLNDEKQAKLNQIQEIAGYEQEAMSVSQALNDLAADSDKKRLQAGQQLSLQVQKEEFKRKQALALVNAAVNIAEGISKAIAQSPETGGLPGSALAAIMGTLQIIKIKSTQFSPEGGGNVSTSASAPTPPSISMSAGQTIGLGQVTPPTPQQTGLQYQQVYVTTKDINKQQNKVTVLNNRTSFG